MTLEILSRAGLSILNVGEGDTKLSFTPGNAAERARCARIVRDMLRRGYVLLVEVEIDGAKTHQRVRDFDESTCEYLIADIEPEPDLAPPGMKEEKDHGTHSEPEQAAASGEAAPAPARRRGRPPKRRVDAGTARAVAVAPSAGG